METKLRHVRIDGHILDMWATDQSDWRGCTKIHYRLKRGKQTIFEGVDFCGSPLHADDSDETVKSLLGFLTLRPNDTDADYFADYTEKQLDWCSQHAEQLSNAVYSRFGETELESSEKKVFLSQSTQEKTRSDRRNERWPTQ